MKKILSMILALTLVAGIIMVPLNGVQAASSVKYTYVTEDNSRNYDFGEIKNYTKLPNLQGSSPAVNKINESIRREGRDRVIKDEKKIREIEKELKTNYDFSHIRDSYIDTLDGQVSYNKENVLSVKYHSLECAGEVYRSDTYGSVFDLATGKKLNIYQVIDNRYASDAQIKAAIYKELDKPSLQTSTFFPANVFQSMPFSKLKDLDFYINGQSRIVVCFRTYTLGSDLDGCITVTLPKKYTLLQQKGNKTKKTAKVKTKIAKEKTVVKDGCYTFWCNTPYYVDTVCKSGNLTILSNGGTYVSYGKNGWAPYDDTKTYPLISKNFKFKLANKVYRWEGEVPSHKVVKFGVVHYVSQAQNLTKENFAKKEHELHGDHGSHIYLCVLVKNGKVVSVGDGPG